MRLALAAALVSLSLGAQASELGVGTGMLCDTREQLEQFIALNGDTKALQTVNAAENVCGMLTFMFDGYETVGQIQTPVGLGEIQKLNIIGIQVQGQWMTSGQPMVQYTIRIFPGRSA